MKIWIITDTHLGHKQMVEYCGRPEHHSIIILENLQKNIVPGDVLIHLGDVCMGADRAWHEQLCNVLPGVFRILIRGNHDKRKVSWYLSHGWNVCLPAGIPMNFFDKTILFSHIPSKHRGPLVSMNIHGHWHNNDHRLDDETKKWYQPGYHRLLEIETNGLMPVLLEDYIK